ncbi:MAG: PilZ domain-containing protein [Bdellovibrionota bacterium]|nr:PilZ domain-containing protein [Bdellovibrionota bacterium]
MERHLNLVESDFEELEKKVFPRFPFCFLTFKPDAQHDPHTFEVKDISHSGMQIALRMGEHDLKKEQAIAGHLHWGSEELKVTGTVKWDTQMRAGIEFSHSPQLREKVSALLDLGKYAERLKPVHKMDYGVEIPARLKYWLRSDGPVEVFVWQHGDGEIAKFEILMMENFVEWEDTKGLRTARVISKRDIDTPLLTEDEFVFQIDPHADQLKITKAAKLVNHLGAELMDAAVVQFITLKLRS